jgi:uncharacterized protein YabE (DUF348 family)/3D (Asp-Asp-Asp) domain-containing protein
VRIPKSKALYVSAAVFTLFGGSAMTANAAYKTVTVQDNGQRKVVRGFTFGSLKSFLRRNHITVTATDKVSPDLDQPVQDGMTVVVERPVDIHVVDGGFTGDVQTTAKTVGQLLQQEHIKLGEKDSVNLPLDYPLADGTWVRIRRVETKTSTSRATIPFQTERRQTDQLYRGQQRVLTHGVKGLRQITKTITYVDGHRSGQSVTTKVLRRPVNEVILVGTQERTQPKSSPRLAARGGSPLGNKIIMTATAYVAGGRTADGRPAQPGVASVDPSVIPLGTRLYIPGVGTLVAADTGGAIHGHRIDICVATESQARAWGVRTVPVYILR